MGTNYYWYKEKPCPTCGRSDAPLHIGKSSAGWCFALHVIPEEGIKDLPDWIERFKSGRIEDEYGRDISAEDMVSTITKRGMGRPKERVPFGYSSWEAFHSSNQSCDGPNGLVRAAIGRHCSGHGEGTWDLIGGEFS